MQRRLTPHRNAGCNCLNAKGVAAIKLEAAPRYQSNTINITTTHRTPGRHGTVPYSCPFSSWITRRYNATAVEIGLWRTSVTSVTVQLSKREIKALKERTGKGTLKPL